MEKKKKIIKKILMSRRILAASKFVEETKLCPEVLLHLQKKRLQLLKQMHLLSTLKISLTSERLNWKNEQRENFWETDCQTADECFFKNKFRMSRKSFHKLCQLLPRRQRNDTEMMSVEKRVAISLYVLGSSVQYHSIAKLFGVNKASICKILLSFCADVWKVLAPIYLKNFPLTKEKIKGFVQEFESIGFPQCMGALGCCHIEINPSRENPADNYKHEECYSIVLLALVDARCRFIYANSGSPGRCYDSDIYQESSLKQQIENCSHLPDLKKIISGVDIPVFIIGDSAFRLSDKLMKPYPSEESQSNKQKRFNYALSKSHRVVKNAFGQLKARFWRIRNGLDNNIRNANTIILSCCALHNFLNENNETIDKEWLQDLETLIKVNRSHPQHIVSLMDHSNNPEKIRNAISNYFVADDAADDNESPDLDGDGCGGGTTMEAVISDGTDDSGDNGSPEVFEFMS